MTNIKRVSAVAAAAVAFVVGGIGAAFAQTPDPAAVAGALANSAGGQLIDTIVGVIPVLIPVMLTLWAIGLVLRKTGVLKKSKV